MAEAITTSGQLSLRTSEKAVNVYMNRLLKTQDIDYVAYGDTDSIFVKMSPLVEKVYGRTDNLDKQELEKFVSTAVTAKLLPAIEAEYDKLAETMGAYRNAMSMKLEKITDRTIFVAKKRYIANVLSSEGVHYAEPKVSVTGIESVRSSTPEICREKMFEAYKVIMSGTEKDAQSFIEEFRQEFKNLPIEEIAKISGTDDIGKFTDASGDYMKGTPIHVRGVILYNKALRTKKISKQFDFIQSGDKVKFVYLKLPNPIFENVISFPSYLPPELDLHKYIDHDLQFEKVFLKPLRTVLEAVNWSSEKIDTLESFFG